MLRSSLATSATRYWRYCIRKYGRAFAVYDPAGVLECVVLNLRGAREVVRRLGGVAVYTKE